MNSGTTFKNFPTMHKQKFTSIFSTTQWKELTELQNNEDIMIEVAGKGNAVVVMSTLYCKNLVISILNESQRYEKVTNYTLRKIMKNLSWLIKTQGKELRTKEIDCLTNFQCKPSLFYSQTKIHKGQIINETIKYSPKTYMHQTQRT